MAKPASGTSLDTGNALYTNISGVWAFLEGTGSTSADSKGSLTLTLNHGSWQTDADGPIWRTTSPSDAQPISFTGFGTSANTDWSLAWRDKQSSDDNNGMIVGNVSGSNAYIWQRGGNYLRVSDDGGTTYQYTDITSFTALKDYLLTYDGTAHQLRLFVNGTESSDSPISVNATISPNVLLQYFGGSLGFVGDFSYLYYWAGRKLTGTDATTIHGSPYGIFLSAATGIAFDAASNSGYQAAQSTYTFNRTCTGTNLFLAVDISILSAGQTVVSVIDDSGGGNVAMTFIGARSTITSFGRVESWGLIAPATGTKSIQVNLSSVVISAAGAVSYTGVNQISPTEAFDSAQATNVGAANATVTITPISDNCWIHAAVATDDTSITAGQTTRNNVTGAGGSGANEDNNAAVTPAGATTMTYTNVGALATWAINGYAIRPTADETLARKFLTLMGIGR